MNDIDLEMTNGNLFVLMWKMHILKNVREKHRMTIILNCLTGATQL
jgi:hypothetical protein